MKSSQEDIILLENYLKNTLSPQERKTMDERLSSEVDLQRDLLELKHFMAAARVQALQEKHDFLRSLEMKENSKLQNGSWKKWLLIIFLLSMLGYLFYTLTLKSNPQPEKKYKGMYAADFDRQLILHKTLRSTVQSDSLSPEQRRAYELYSLQLFDEAAPLLQTLWQEKKDTIALFYLGVSRVGMGQTEEGLEILNRDELTKYRDKTNLFFNQ